ncbi:hypothetical protein ABID21_004980 [Pseudorhizobium tarimense]|uniref:NIPSNAP domain-containing protein n=2 Tax=Pseudorhizobium tarimense TaxID=1079109 RepID=A0ABV2HE68_9HYPH|nr:NIPSNAP family protein [Pseudorhizobium tarimense]
MITCGLEYRIDWTKQAEFEAWCRMWLELIPEFGGVHHGHFLPSEGHSNVALGLFSFRSLAEYESYRIKAKSHPGALSADQYKAETGCVRSWDSRFFTPLFPSQNMPNWCLHTTGVSS